MSRVGRIIMFAIAAAGIVGGIALFALGLHWAPSDPHHGEAIDGLDGLATFAALLAGGGGVAALAIGGLALRSALRA